MSAVADKLREARALIERGWTQGAYCDDINGRASFCMVGALDEVIHDTEGYWAVTEALKRSIGTKGTLFAWNDTPGRTQAEVLAAFDKAIELAEAQS